MIQTEDQRFEFIREQVTRDWLTCGDLHQCKEQQPELLCWMFSTGHTRIQTAQGPALPGKRRRNQMDLGNQKQGNMVHRRKSAGHGRCKAKVMIWEDGATQGDIWEKEKAQKGKIYLHSSLDFLQG